LFEAPRPARTLRQLPGLLERAIRFVLTADRAGMVLVTVLAFVAALGTGVAVLVTQRVLADVLAAGQGAAGLGTALPALALLALVNIVLGLARTLQERRREVLAELVGRQAEERVLSVTTQVRLADFDDPVFHDRVQRASHGTRFGPLTLVQGLTQLMSGLLGAAGLILALATIAPLLVALVLLGYLPAWVALQANGLDRFRFIRLQTPLERRRSYVFSLLSGRPHAKEVRAYGPAEELLRRWRVLGDQRRVELRGDVRRRARRELVGDALSQTLAGGTLLVLAWMIASGRLSVPQAGAAGAALLGLRGQLTSVTFGAGQLYEASLFVADYEAFMAVATRVRPDGPTAAAAPSFDEVTVEGVTFTYPGASSPALVDVDLRMRAGEVVALVGENGSGKTTLAKLLAGLYHPASGRICWDGIDLAALDGDQLRRGIAVVFQDFEQYAFTAYDNIAFGMCSAWPTRTASGRRRDAPTPTS
jgi:ATP-binding cassette, subfamily B, bacterial